MAIGFASFMLIIFLIILDYLVYFAHAAPMHHIRHWHSIRHYAEELKPVPFIGRMSELDQVNQDDRSKILQGLHKFMVKHSKHIVDEPVSSLPGIPDGTIPSHVVIPANVEFDKILEERDDYKSKMAEHLAEKQIQRLNKVITPQLDVLKKKAIYSATE